jgi:ankyrin repeat protein
VLVQAKADVDQVGNSGMMPACAAARDGHVDALLVLLGAQADVDKARNDGWTLIFFAANQGRTDALRVLVQVKVDMDKTSTKGATPVFTAADNGHADALHVLVHAKADVDQVPSPPALEAISLLAVQSCSYHTGSMLWQKEHVGKNNDNELTGKLVHARHSGSHTKRVSLLKWPTTDGRCHVTCRSHAYVGQACTCNWGD